MTKNKALARATLDLIEKDREHWNQESYATAANGYAGTAEEWNECGTTHCFGGWAGVLSGAKFSPKVYLDCKRGHSGWRDRSGHHIRNFENWVAKKLGLTQDEAFDIFYYFTKDWYAYKAFVQEVFDL